MLLLIFGEVVLDDLVAGVSWDDAGLEETTAVVAVDFFGALSLADGLLGVCMLTRSLLTLPCPLAMVFFPGDGGEGDEEERFSSLLSGEFRPDMPGVADDEPMGVGLLARSSPALDLVVFLVDGGEDDGWCGPLTLVPGEIRTETIGLVDNFLGVVGTVPSSSALLLTMFLEELFLRDDLLTRLFWDANDFGGRTASAVSCVDFFGTPFALPCGEAEIIEGGVSELFADREALFGSEEDSPDTLSLAEEPFGEEVLMRPSALSPPLRVAPAFFLMDGDEGDGRAAAPSLLIDDTDGLFLLLLFEEGEVLLLWRFRFVDKGLEDGVDRLEEIMLLLEEDECDEECEDDRAMAGSATRDQERKTRPIIVAASL
mmetsp:Transcript_27746/g.59311  ORF Transcript_27746/g.59311 Transcript_27746/m.59311 type:complete len:371 (-) Transcript_27746:350-1462(-)